MRRVALAVCTTTLTVAFAGLASTQASNAAGGEDPTPAGSGQAAVERVENQAPEVLAPSQSVYTGAGILAPAFVAINEVASSTNSSSDASVNLKNGEFTVDGLRVTPINAIPEGNGVLAGGAAVVQATDGGDIDTIVRPTSMGVETFMIANSSAAQTTTTWKVDVPPGAALIPLGDGSVALTEAGVASETRTGNGAADSTESSDVNAVTSQLTDPVAAAASVAADLQDARTELGSQILAHVSAPVAWDANGNPVTSRLTVEGNTVTLTVEHRNPGVTYPVIADPVWWAGATEYTGFGGNYPLDKVKNDIDTMNRNGLDYVVLSPQLLQTMPDDTYTYLPYIYNSATIRYPNRDAGCAISNDGAFDNNYIEKLVAAGKYAENKGIAVIVKPLLNPAKWHYQGDSHFYYMDDASASRTKIAASDSDAWWDHYTCKMLAYSDIAAAINQYSPDAHPNLPAVKYIVGTELTGMTDQNYDSERMSSLIVKLHNQHSGLDLGYAANYDALVPDRASLDDYFYSRLDFIGVDAYYVAPKNAVRAGASAAEIKDKWGSTVPAGTLYSCEAGSERDVNVGKPGTAVQCIHDRYNKPVVISELGYETNSARGLAAAYSFWADWVDARPGRCGWFKGIWLWAEATGADAFDLSSADYDQAAAKARGQLTGC